MDLYRLRIEMPDEPGAAGRVLVALGELAVNVVEIDCHNVGGGVRMDDLFVHATQPLDIPAIAVAVERTGCPVVEVCPIAVHELEDPVTRGMRLTNQVATAPLLTDDMLAWCAGGLVRADLAWVVDSRVASPGSLAERALRERVAVHGREWVKRLVTPGDEPWLLAAPLDVAGRRSAVVVARAGSRFTRTETARLRALLEAARNRSDAVMPTASTGRH